MRLIGGQERIDLEELAVQLRSHGAGGGSTSLTKAMEKFGVVTMHGLAIHLINRLLSMDIGIIGSGGGTNIEPPKNIVQFPSKVFITDHEPESSN